MKQCGGKEIDVYHIEIEGVMVKFKHFKVMTEADNIFKEEQPQIAEVIPPTPAASKLHLTQTKLIMRQILDQKF